MASSQTPSTAKGNAAMAVLGVGWCSTALLLAWPNNDGTSQPETGVADLAASVERTQQPDSGPRLVEVPDEGVAYYHPDHGKTIIIKNEQEAAQ